MDRKDDPRMEELTRLKRIIIGAVTVGCSSLLLIIFISVTTQLSVQKIHSVLEDELRYCKESNENIHDYVHSAYQMMGVERRKRETGSTTSNTTNTTIATNGTLSDSNSTVIHSTKDVKVTVVPPVTVSIPQPCSCGIGPAGDKGEDGEDGKDGTDGQPGADGEAGADYEGEYKGGNEDWCFTCPKAPAGQKGRPGPNGYKGRPGAEGEPGRDGISSRGGPGFPGQAGVPGYMGQRGLTGPNGVVVRVNGPFGQRGVPGNKGSPGAPGENGRDASDGRDGRQGEEGEPGNRGAPGRDGMAGQRGWQGRQGAEGSCAHCVRSRPVAQAYHQSFHVFHSTPSTYTSYGSSSPYTTVYPPAAEPPAERENPYGGRTTASGYRP